MSPRHLLCALVLFRLLTDLATPLLPGAFRFDAQSLDACREDSVRAQEPTALPAMPGQAPAPRVHRREIAPDARLAVEAPRRWGASLARRGLDQFADVAADPPAARSAA